MSTPDAIQPAPAPSDEALATADLTARFAAEGLPALIGHRSAIGASEAVEQVYQAFRVHGHEFMAVLEGGKLLGLCARREVGMLLGARYGFALFARKPIRAHLMRFALCVEVTFPIAQVFEAAFSRDHESYYDDVVLLDESGDFVGLIFTATLVRLQHQFLEANIRELEESQRVIREKNAQIEDDLRLAHELQVALLPERYPTFPATAAEAESALRFAHRYQTSNTVGGDFFHVHALGDRVAGILLCDVMGHGVRSALVTTMLRALVEELKPLAADPGALLAQLNRELRQILEHAEGDMFATAVSAVIDAESGGVRFAIAGHPSPVVRRAAGGTWNPLLPHGCRVGPALGLLPEARYQTHSCAVATGDGIVFYTDGLYEVDGADGEELGKARLMALIGETPAQPLEQLLDGTLAQVRAFSATGKFDDDVCLLAVEVSRVGADLR